MRYRVEVRETTVKHFFIEAADDEDAAWRANVEYGEHEFTVDEGDIELTSVVRAPFQRPVRVVRPQ